jgi:hypothetical protein
MLGGWTRKDARKVHRVLVVVVIVMMMILTARVDSGEWLGGGELGCVGFAVKMVGGGAGRALAKGVIYKKYIEWW